MKDESEKNGRRVQLTPEVQATIITYIRSGSFDHVAARAAGVSPRTLRGWLARGNDTSPRPSAKIYVDFAAAVDQARAEARVLAEAKVHGDKPLAWLGVVARSKDGEEGWSKPTVGVDPASLSYDELSALIHALQAEQLARDPDMVIPPCTAANCRCILHRPRSLREQRRLEIRLKEAS